ncbi:hypothetical protein EDF31_11231 [Curtobacterium sp. PhB142]|uniref:hypothetical protein n=1 Tax=unclassified Curtobacterium TaxID=257496 RepID=UPI001044F169|nr:MULTISPECIES: hypothetical protein [unclassified Curtobacterium]TCL80513.1 hypothetical protein EDF31_11231 [Curtobacterium sp. PhB142]TCL99753.1 hypothetical protein EDF26_11331 [Curtobacterium sp. PhB134]TCU43918.1 hypothetical protein EDF33_10731 [Curtobacterium sp. PhB146]TDW43099.1 hypothetical protein EDF52_11353 [Curtobacterium sp. PhB42]TDW53603.1 hypothetical protein EDF47_109115 [Curtobacterium sp. PhB190]
MIVIGWILLAGTVVLIFTGTALFAVGFFTGNQVRVLQGFGLAVVAIAALAISNALGPVAGVLLIAVTALAAWLLRRRIRQLNTTTLEQTGPTR